MSVLLTGICLQLSLLLTTGYALREPVLGEWQVCTTNLFALQARHLYLHTPAEVEAQCRALLVAPPPAFGFDIGEPCLAKCWGSSL